jgi:SAM-dependent methyltransferase
MNTIGRVRDAIDGTSIESLGGFERFPVYMGCVTHPEEHDVYSEMVWDISPTNGLIQLRNLIPLEILYPENHAGAIGETWMMHHKSFAKFLKRFRPNAVLEIGGAHGILSREYAELDPSASWTIIEPNPIPTEGVKAKFIRGFFDQKVTLESPVDSVVHSHVFEHVYEPVVFVMHISAFLEPGKHLIFSLPNMEEMLRRKYTNCINFEHTLFLTEPYVEYLLQSHGFRLIEKEYFLDDHSIFYSYIRDLRVKPTELPSGLYERNRQLYVDYVCYHEQLIENLNKKISNLSPNQDLYLFGAHVFAQYLIGFGLNTSRIKCILDNDPQKQGKRLYGSSLKVASPKILNQITSPVVILKAGVYNQEIREGILSNINPRTVFI